MMREPGDKRTLLLMISSLRGGGAERVMADIAGYLAERDTEVTLMTLDDLAFTDAYPLPPSVIRLSIYRVPGRNRVEKLWRTFERVVAVRQVLKQRRPHVVLSFMTVTNVIAILASRGLSIRIVVSERTDPEMDQGLKRHWWYGRRYLYKAAYCVIAQRARACEWLRENTDSKVRCIPNAIRALPTPGQDREDLIIGVGRLSVEKGFDTLINAFALVATAHPQWRLVLIGEGDQKDYLARLGQSLGLNDSIEFLGWIEDVAQWQARASIVAQPSRFEGFPNVVLEAMAMGAPVIASTAAGEDIIEDGKNGLLVPVDDVQKLASSMLDLMEDPSLRSSLGDAAKAVRNRFSMQRIMPMWETVLFAKDGARAVCQRSP